MKSVEQGLSPAADKYQKFLYIKTKLSNEVKTIKYKSIKIALRFHNLPKIHKGTNSKTEREGGGSIDLDTLSIPLPP